MASPIPQAVPDLAVMRDPSSHEFAIPKKCIHEGSDVPAFLVSHAYRDILAFLVRLNRAMFPSDGGSRSGESTPVPQTFPMGANSTPTSPAVRRLAELLRDLDAMIKEAPPDPGPRRFGNLSFRTWSGLLEERSQALLEKHLDSVLSPVTGSGDVSAAEEVRAYLLGAFGSSQRLDYGTGHELSFLAFLGGLWKLGGFGQAPSAQDSREIVLGVVQPYLELVRKLILTYNLEPAGSHGVWGLDDHSFAPYIFGSAQYGPLTRPEAPTPTEGSLDAAPDPGGVTSPSVVQRERKLNMYFSAIGFIYDVKTGPFWEHSPTLYDISGVRAGWGKINKGMLKMYVVEVLGKFPVVQHFPFGSLFSFEKDPAAKAPASTAHTSSQPQRQPGPTAMATPRPGPGGTQAPWARAGSGAPAARALPSGRSPAVPRRDAAPPPADAGMPPPTKAPWAK